MRLQYETSFVQDGSMEGLIGSPDNPMPQPTGFTPALPILSTGAGQCSYDIIFDELKLRCDAYS
jgi:hypothetical protein